MFGRLPPIETGGGGGGWLLIGGGGGGLVIPVEPPPHMHGQYFATPGTPHEPGPQPGHAAYVSGHPDPPVEPPEESKQRRWQQQQQQRVEQVTI